MIPRPGHYWSKHHTAGYITGVRLIRFTTSSTLEHTVSFSVFFDLFFSKSTITTAYYTLRPKLYNEHKLFIVFVQVLPVGKEVQDLCTLSERALTVC